MNTPKTLQLLTDSTAPIEKDAFNHEVYADLLREIFTPSSDNRGMSVGLFGKWGQGKSSVVDMLKQRLPKKTKLVVFNAWTARGDSVRRQMVLSILETINPKKAKTFKQHSGIHIPKEFDEEKWLSTITGFLKTFFSVLTSPFVGVTLVGSFILAIAVLFAFRQAFQTESFQDVWTAAAAIFAAACAFLFLRTCETVKTIYDQHTKENLLSEHQLLKFPEQFAEIASRYLAIYCKANKSDVLLVVDDLDRCDPSTVVEALAAIKQLSGITMYESSRYPVNIRFLIPCDEKQVVLALEADGHDAGDEGGRYHDYQSEELLRKFFDVIVRMDQLLPQDLTQYAEDLATEIGITDLQAIRNLIHAVSPKDPRQVKKLINAFKTAMRRVELSQERGLLEDLSDLTNTLLAIVALRETYPCVYNDLIAPAPERLSLLCDENYDELNKLEEITGRSDVEQKRLKNSLHKAGKMLLRVPGIHMSTAELLIHGQADPELRGVPRQGELHRSVLANNSEQFLKAIPESEEHRNQVFKWLNGKIETGNIPEKIQEHLSFILDYAKENPSGLDYVTNSLHHLLENTRYQGEVLEFFKRIDELAEAVVLLSPEEQEIFWSNIEIKSPLGNTGSLFFSVGNRLPSMAADYLMDELKSLLDSEHDASDEKISTPLLQIWSCLSENRKHSFGLLPQIGQKILTDGWRPSDYDEGENHTIQTDIGLHLIGNNPEPCYETLLKIIEDGVWDKILTIATASDDFYPAWYCVTELLQRMDKERVAEFFDYLHEQVLAKQSGDLVEYLYERLKPVLYSFTDEQLASMGTALGTRLSQNNNDWIFKFIGTPQDGAKWNTLTQSCTKQYLARIPGNTPCTEHAEGTLAKIKKANWDITEMLDSFMVKIFDHLPNRIHLKKWADVCLDFLAGKKTPETKEKIILCITNNQFLDVSIHVGVNTCWRASISKEDAELVADRLVKAPVADRNLTGFESSYAQIANKRGADIFFNTLVTKINGFDINWRRTNQDLLKYVAENISKASVEKQRDFNASLESMLASGHEPTILSALKVAGSLPNLDKTLKKLIRDLTESENTSDPVKTACSELLKK
jgi:hypothetical protein